MTETLTDNPLEANVLQHDEPANPGELLRAERQIEINGDLWTTNLPDGIYPLEPEDSDYPVSIKSIPIVPHLLDDLPIGTFTIGRMIEDYDELGRSVTVLSQRNIGVKDSKKGKVISSGSFIERPHSFPKQLMEMLGYEFTEDGLVVTGVPTPDTVVVAAGEVGVSVELFPEFACLPGDVYVNAFAEGKYPVATKSETFYLHDISDDHITTMIVGGEALKSTLKGVALNALANGDQKSIARLANGIDIFTATLRAVTINPPQILGESYGKERGRSTLYQAGEDIGISHETCDQIVLSTQDQAKDLGLQVREIN